MYIGWHAPWALEYRPARQRLPNKEVARLGKAIYEQDIRHQVEDVHHGEIVAIDVDSGRGMARRLQ